MEYAYVRVSTINQNNQRQVVMMQDRCIPSERIFLEKASAKDRKRPELARLLEMVSAGDVIVVESVSRMARDIKDFFDILAELEAKDVGFVSIKEQLDILSFSGQTPIRKLVMGIVAVIAEFERAIMLERQAEGIAAAKAAGTHCGRPAKRCPQNFPEIVLLYKSGKIDLDTAKRMSGFGKTTFYSRMREYLATLT